MVFHDNKASDEETINPESKKPATEVKKDAEMDVQS